jgi:hypothetical protein
MEVGPLPDDDGPSVRLITVESFDMFFRREYPRLVTLAYALSGSRELAEDAAQQAFGGYQVGPLDLPTFLALGRYDYMIPFYLWDRSKQHLSNLRYKLYEKRGHHPPYEQPVEFAADLPEPGTCKARLAISNGGICSDHENSHTNQRRCCLRQVPQLALARPAPRSLATTVRGDLSSSEWLGRGSASVPGGRSWNRACPPSRVA